MFANKISLILYNAVSNLLAYDMEWLNLILDHTEDDTVVFEQMLWWRYLSFSLATIFYKINKGLIQIINEHMALEFLLYAKTSMFSFSMCTFSFLELIRWCREASKSAQIKF